ncbi:MAG: OmpH family outer membrane protein [Deltaproteobacteria bacterium]|nr:OmpH family outer membrane protein [Deltaproteobacteria bacterium]
MRASRTFLAIGLLAVLVGATGADDEPLRIAVVDVNQALNSTDEGKAAREELARKQREAEARVQPRIERFKELQEELKSKKFVLSEDALYQRQLDLLELKNEIESEMKELEGKFKVDEERIVGPLRKKMINVVQSIGREQGFTLIVERASPGLLYSREALDITDAVIEQFNKKKG